MAGLSELKLRLGISLSDRTRDDLLALLLRDAGEWAKSYCRLSDGGAIPDALLAEMAAHDYGALGAEGVASRSLSGLTEKYREGYPEHILARLRSLRRVGVPS